MDLTNLQRQLEEAKSLSSPRTAVLLGREDLLGEAVEAILKAGKNWIVVRIPDHIDADQLTREMEKVNPDILIVLQENCVDSFPPPLHLIQHFSNLKIITINPENNFMEVFNRQKVWVREATDLITAIDQLEHPESKEVK